MRQRPTESDSRISKRVDERRDIEWVTVGSDVIGPQRVDGYQDDPIGSPIRLAVAALRGHAYTQRQ